MMINYNNKQSEFTYPEFISAENGVLWVSVIYFPEKKYITFRL